MVLGDVLTDKDGTDHRMAGLLPVETSFAAPKLHLGYRQLSLSGDCLLGAKGSAYRGHEFHYASLIKSGGEPLFEGPDARGAAWPSAGIKTNNGPGS